MPDVQATTGTYRGTVKGAMFHAMTDALIKGNITPVELVEVSALACEWYFKLQRATDPDSVVQRVLRGQRS